MILTPSWAYLGPSWVQLAAILSQLKAIRNQRTNCSTTALMKHPSATSFPPGPKMARRCPKIAIIQHPKPMLSILLLLLLLLLLLSFLLLLLLLLLRLLQHPKPMLSILLLLLLLLLLLPFLLLLLLLLLRLLLLVAYLQEHSNSGQPWTMGPANNVQKTMKFHSHVHSASFSCGEMMSFYTVLQKMLYFSKHSVFLQKERISFNRSFWTIMVCPSRAKVCNANQSKMVILPQRNDALCLLLCFSLRIIVGVERTR